MTLLVRFIAFLMDFISIAPKLLSLLGRIVILDDGSGDVKITRWGGK